MGTLADAPPSEGGRVGRGAAAAASAVAPWRRFLSVANRFGGGGGATLPARSRREEEGAWRGVGLGLELGLG